MSLGWPLAGAGALLLMCGASAAEARDPMDMPLGRAVTPPLGYLRFCEREPDDCPSSKAAGAATGQGGRRRSGQTFWSSAFRGRAGPESDNGGPATLADPPSSIQRERRPVALIRPPPPRATVAAPEITADHRIRLTRETRAALNQVNRQVNSRVISASDWQIHRQQDYWALPLSRGRLPAGDCEDYVMEKRHQLLAAGFPMAELSIALVRTRRGDTHAVLLVETDQGALALDNHSARVRPWWKLDYRWIMRQSPGSPGRWVSILASGASGRSAV